MTYILLRNKKDNISKKCFSVFLTNIGGNQNSLFFKMSSLLFSRRKKGRNEGRIFSFG